MTKTAITLFTGGGLADVALAAAGFRVIAGLEIDPEIAAVANMNLGNHVRVGDVLEANPADFPACDLLHASPPCPNFSIAKADGEETEQDIALAEKVAEFVEVLKPKHFTLENVQGYRKSKSFKIITDALSKCGYKYRACVLNSANFGVAQTRVRLIVLASLSKLPHKPLPTHQRAGNEQQTGLFERSLPVWIGWYQAIEDLIQGLPESKFADWQLKRLPTELSTSLMSKMELTSTIRTINPRLPNEPSATITADDWHRPSSIPRAFIIGGGNTNKEIVDSKARFYDSPAFTVATDSGIRNTRAFILDGKPNDMGQSVTVPHSNAPMLTVVAQHGGRQALRAFLANESSTMECREADEPSASQVASTRNVNQRAWLEDGRVVSMTPRALARFQSLPDWYELPASNILACRIIGNGFPCLMAQRVFEQFI
jgi:DNA-cytosine methyltransferase